MTGNNKAASKAMWVRRRIKMAEQKKADAAKPRPEIGWMPDDPKGDR